MSQAHGDLSGARPPQEYSSCEQSFTHITLGSGPSIQQYPSTQHHASQLPQQFKQYHQQEQQQQGQQYSRPHQRHGEGGHTSAVTGGLQPLPGAGVSSIFESRSAPLGPGTAQVSPTFPELSRPCEAGGPGGGVDSQASPQDFFCPPQVYDNSMMLKEQGVGGLGDLEENINDENDDRDGHDLDDGADGNSQGSGKRSRTRRPHLQGRFSGRLTTKEDERRLAEECKLLGPLLGGVGKRGDKSRLTLAKIVRGIATGDVRRFCEERERAIAALKTKLAAIDPEAAASVPVSAIPIASAGLGSLGGISIGPMVGLGGSMGLSTGSMGGPPLGISMHTSQTEKLQRENLELRGEMYSLRMELQARERLLLELQDTGIISGFVPTSIPLDDPQRLMAHAGAPGGTGAGGHLSGPGAGRTHSTDMAPSYSMPQRHQSYGTQPMPSYGGPSQMSIPQSSAHMSGGMEHGPMGSGAMGMGPGLGQQSAGGPGIQPGGGGPLVGESSALTVVPAMSEHSRASRPLKRPAMQDLGGAGGSSGGYADMPRSLSHPPMGRGGGGGGGGGGGSGGYPHIDLQQQLNSLQAQVEQLQNLSQAQVGSRNGASFLMPARERSSAQVRMGMGGGGGTGGGGGSSQMHYTSSAGGMAPSPFISSHSTGPQGGLLMLPGHQASEASTHPFQAHPAIGGPLHLQVGPEAGIRRG
ncbi:hypothetical protein Vretimale_19731 [Volvox reticuliferus]|uniref:Uncharacterized protein n=1 Tax=Volvox reticuliferus TaxID=1737510 RepID=A0A8J4LZZ6_9CHLO|nr:hypothetical protein Vretimale_19731 [Volvox reticuliferus]